MKQAHIIISGVVQGVGFRFFVKSWAKDLRITGWVKNTPDGKVEAVFQGEEKSIKDLIEKCRKGPFLAEVKNIEVEWTDTKEEFIDFRLT